MSALSWSVRERAILTVFVLVCCIYGAYTWVYLPSLAQGERTVDLIRTSVKKLEEQQRVIAKEKRVPEALRDALEARRQTVSSQEVFSGLLSEIEASARAMNFHSPSSSRRSWEPTCISRGLSAASSLTELAEIALTV